MFTSIANVATVVFTRIVNFVKSIFTLPARVWNFFAKASSEEISDLVIEILKVAAVTLIGLFVSGFLVKVALILLSVEDLSEHDDVITETLGTDAPATE